MYNSIDVYNEKPRPSTAVLSMCSSNDTPFERLTHINKPMPIKKMHEREKRTSHNAAHLKINNIKKQNPINAPKIIASLLLFDPIFPIK